MEKARGMMTMIIAATQTITVKAMVEVMPVFRSLDLAGRYVECATQIAK